MTEPARIQSISWNVTYRCNLRCSHCYTGGGEGSEDRGELAIEEVLQVIDDLEGMNKRACLILTGGEPLLRPDIFKIASHASSKGLTVFLGTNGTLIDGKVVKRIVESGISGVGVSIDSINPEVHDSFRGVKGAWEHAIRALKVLCDARVPSVIQFSMMDFNRHDLEDLVRFALSLGHRVLNIYYLVCTGRGEMGSNLGKEEYIGSLMDVAELQRRYGRRIWLNVKCAPSYKRRLHEVDGGSPWLKAYRGGCPAGIYYCRITPDGHVTPCPYMPLSCGDLRRQGLREVWTGADVLLELRGMRLKGRCGACEFSEVCIGCRARAFAETGDYMEEDSLCDYTPSGGGKKVFHTFYGDCERAMPWTGDALAILDRIPSFARGMVIKGVEELARGKGLSLVTAEQLREMRRIGPAGGGGR